MQGTLYVLFPERHELLEYWKSRGDVVFLPDKGLEEERRVREMVEYLRRREPVVVPKMPLEVDHKPI